MLLLTAATVCPALSPDEVVVVANRNAAGSVGLAKYYMEKRGIPGENLILLWVTDQESCSREEYDKKVVPPIRRNLREKYPPYKIRCLVTVYGVPLKVEAPKLAPGETAELARLEKEKKELVGELASGGDAGQKERIAVRLKALDADMQALKFKLDRGASLDSELSLVLAEKYDIGGWIPNPYFEGFQGQGTGVAKKDVLMVSRLDGPKPEVVRRIIDDSLKAEEMGLRGTAYLDARWPDPGEKSVSGYSLYDRSLHRTADMFRKRGVPVTLESTEALFGPGECRDVALYCGWYSLARYVDAFQWRPGAVGYHIASSECATLKNPESQVWCKRMLEEGAAAVVGPVDEPYVQSFPVPEIFFANLIEGELSLAECYLLSVPYLSWKQVLVGDPLYRPFKKR